MAAEKSSAHLHGARPHCQRVGDPLAIDDTASGNHRQIGHREALRQQGQGALLQGEIIREEMAAMTTRLQSLSDDGIGAVLSKPYGLRHRGGTGKYLGPRSLHLDKQLGRGQAEVKADHRRSELGHHGGMILIERCTAWRRRNSWGLYAELGVVGSKPLLPAGQCNGIRFPLPMAEEVDVKWPKTTLGKTPQFVA